MPIIARWTRLWRRVRPIMPTLIRSNMTDQWRCQKCQLSSGTQPKGFPISSGRSDCSKTQNLSQASEALRQKTMVCILRRRQTVHTWQQVKVLCAWMKKKKMHVTMARWLQSRSSNNTNRIWTTAKITTTRRMVLRLTMFVYIEARNQIQGTPYNACCERKFKDIKAMLTSQQERTTHKSTSMWPCKAIKTTTTWVKSSQIDKCRPWILPTKVDNANQITQSTQEWRSLVETWQESWEPHTSTAQGKFTPTIQQRESKKPLVTPMKWRPSKIKSVSIRDSIPCQLATRSPIPIRDSTPSQTRGIYESQCKCASN